jgi:hypothetical protein
MAPLTRRARWGGPPRAAGCRTRHRRGRCGGRGPWPRSLGARGGVGARAKGGPRREDARIVVPACGARGGGQTRCRFAVPPRPRPSPPPGALHWAEAIGNHLSNSPGSDQRPSPTHRGQPGPARRARPSTGRLGRGTGRLIAPAAGGAPPLPPHAARSRAAVPGAAAARAPTRRARRARRAAAGAPTQAAPHPTCRPAGGVTSRQQQRRR